MITRKHFEAIALVIRSSKGFYSDAANTRDIIARELASVFEQDNPNFNRKRFLMACDISSVRP